jgi:transcriptional regulator with XRE-family HTH domain
MLGMCWQGGSGLCRVGMQQSTPRVDPGQSGRSGTLRINHGAGGTKLGEADVTQDRSGLGSGPTVRRMLVGAQLRRLRTDMGLSREESAEAIRASEWKIHRLENGQVGFKDRDIVDLLRLYGVTDPDEVAGFLEFAREANAPGWWQHYGDLLPQWFRVYVDLESAATLIRTYEGQLVPGLLQTEDYMRAVIGGAQLDEQPEEGERRVALRMGRQTLLSRRDAPRLWAVIDEAALRRPVGSPEVMRGQLERLIDAAKLANVVLQILPFGAGAHPAMVGAFSILRFADQELPDVVYVEHLTNALYLDRRDDVNRYLHVMDRISMRAAPPDKTVDILHKILQES